MFHHKIIVRHLTPERNILRNGSLDGLWGAWTGRVFAACREDASDGGRKSANAGVNQQTSKPTGTERSSGSRRIMMGVVMGIAVG